MANFSKQNIKGIVLPAAVLLTICVIISLALALANNVTAGRIAELEEQNQREAMSRLVKAETYEPAAYTTDASDSKSSFTYYIAKNGDEAVAYLFILSTKGYGGDVSVMTAVEPQGSVKAVAILDVSNETPGLGQNAAKESFYSQFAGKTKDISLLKNGAKADKNEIDAVTGATITSTAVTRAVNEALDQFETIKEANADVE